MTRVTVINLRRRPDRKAMFLERNKDIPGLEFDIIEGVDGQTLDMAMVEKSRLLAPECKMPPGHLACSIGHYFCIEKIAKSGEMGIVAEDDAIFRHDFAEQWERLYKGLPEDWDVVLFGWNFDSCFIVELMPGLMSSSGFRGIKLSDEALMAFQSGTVPVGMCPLKNAFGLMAYAVSPKGARRIMKDCFPMRNTKLDIKGKAINSFSLDCLMNVHYPKWSAFVTVPPLVATANDKSQSDTEMTGAG